MKTPREILLQKHQAAMPSLDSIRADVLRAELAPRSAPGRSPGFLRTLWEELILPARRTWAGFACAWVVVLVLHGATSIDESPRHATAPAPVTPETRMALQQQEKLLAELLNEPPPATPRRRPVDGPRSERRPVLRFA